jgi:hypothetical protein
MGWVKKFVKDPIDAVTDNKFTSSPTGILTGVALLATGGMAAAGLLGEGAVAGGLAGGLEGAAGAAAADGALVGGLEGLGGLAAADAAIPTVVIPGVAGGGAGLAGLGDLGLSVGIPGALANGFSLDPSGHYVNNIEGNYDTTPDTTDYTPDIVKDQNVLNNATTSLDKGTTTAINNAVGSGSNLSLNDVGGLVKNISNLGAALNDKSNNQNTAANANSQLNAILQAANEGKIKQDNYIKELQGAASTASASNKDYLKDLNSLSTNIGQNNTKYLSDLNSLSSTIGQNNSDYITQMQARAAAADAAAANYASMVESQQSAANAADDKYVSQLMGMYMPGTPEATLMQQQLNAKDAAAGRNSQYGVRSVDLNAYLAEQRRQTMLNSNYVDAMHHKYGNSLTTDPAYQKAIYRSVANDLLTSGAYKDAINGTAQKDLLTSGAYQNAVNNTAQKDLLTSGAYQNAVSDKAANDILTSAAMAGTVNNNQLLNALTNPATTGLNTTMVNGQNNQNNSLWATAGQAATTIGNVASGATKLIDGLGGLFS